MKNKIYAVGLGPGSPALLSPRAEEVLRKCDTIAGYGTYLRQIPHLMENKRIIASGMRQELDRCRAALEAAVNGASVAVVSSGDPGIYGMAGLLMELSQSDPFHEVDVEVIPGITAASAAAALVGAPLMCDFAVISLSDLLADRTTILKRLTAAAEADFVTALYNPGSSRRRDLLEQAVALFRRTHDDSLPVAVVHDVARPQQRFTLCRIADFPFAEVDMTTILIIGCSRTVIRNGKMFTLRGYQEKYGGFAN